MVILQHVIYSTMYNIHSVKSTVAVLCTVPIKKDKMHSLTGLIHPQ